MDMKVVRYEIKWKNKTTKEVEEIIKSHSVGNFFRWDGTISCLCNDCDSDFIVLYPGLSERGLGYLRGCRKFKIEKLSENVRDIYLS